MSEEVVMKLFVNAQSWGTVTVLCDSTDCYINLPELLNILEFAYELQPEQKIFKAVVSTAGDYYTVNCDTLRISADGRISIGDVRWNSADELFLKSNYIYQIYGIRTNFTMSSLALDLITSQPVPAVLRQQRQARKTKLLKEKGDNILTNIDTVALSNFRVNSVGYNISPYFNSDGSVNWGLRGNTNGELLKGSFLVNYNYSSNYDSPWNDNLTFGWNKPLLNKKWLKSVNVYHDYSNLITTTRGYVTGVSISNEKRSSYLDRYYSYQGRTTPDTEVEIYNNGTLIQYVHSDSTGHYEVEIPTYGGDNKIVAISYDSFGLPVSSEELIYLPPDMQAKGRLGYRLSAGYTDEGRFFVAPMLTYGLTKYITLLAGNETLFGSQKATSIALLGAKVAVTKKFRLDLNYAPLVKWDFTLSTNIGRMLNGNITYERFNPDQTVIDYNPEQRLLATFNGDLPFKSLRGNYNLSVQYYKYPFGESFSTYLGVYYWWRKILTNLSVSTGSDCMKLENMAYTVRVGYNISSRLYGELSAEYQSRRSDFQTRARVNYQFKNQLTAYLESEYGFRSKRYSVSLGMSWRLPWMQIKSGMFNAKNYTSGYMGISGSAIFQEHGVAFSDRYVAGSSILVAMYVDSNGNKVYDKGEPIFKDANVLVHTSGEEKRTAKGVLYTNIPANQAFKIVIPQQNFPDITWQIEHQQINLLFSSYQSRSFYIPIKVISEVSGRVYIVKKGVKVGVKGAKLTITDTKMYTSVTIKTDDWGYYNYMGLTCGTYKIDIPAAELAALKLKKEGDDLPLIVIEPALEGEQIDLLNIESLINIY